mgnify:CR=1 FL=1
MLRLLPLAWLIVVVPAVQAEDLVGGPFRLARDKRLRVQHQDRTLIARDTLEYTPGFEQAGQIRVDQRDGAQVLNVVQSQGDPVTYRKEVAVSDKGLELTVKYKLPAYANDPAKPMIHYAFYVPLETVRGASWKAYVGRAHSAKVVEGKAGASLTGIRYIGFRSPDRRLVFDFNPQGVTANGDYCGYGEPVACWGMHREEEFLVFTFGYRASFYGGVYMSKCLIYEGDYDYKARHAYDKWGYRGPTLPTRLFAFGTAKPPQEATAADLALYSPERGFGWRDVQGLALSQSAPSGLTRNRLVAAAGREGQFLVDLVPGRWLVTVRVAAGDQPQGPMQVLIAGQPVAAPLSVPAEEVRSLTAVVDHPGLVDLPMVDGPGRPTEGREDRAPATNLRSVPGPRFVRDTGPSKPLEITFRAPGVWSVSSIALQPLLYRSEDFSFARGLWNVDGVFTPQ